MAPKRAGKLVWRKVGCCRTADLDAKRTDEFAINVKPYEIAVSHIIGCFDMSFEEIFEDYSGTQIRSITELEYSVPFEVVAGNFGRYTVREIYQLSGTLN